MSPVRCGRTTTSLDVTHEQEKPNGEHRCLETIKVSYAGLFYLMTQLICLRCNFRRKNRGRRSRKRPSNPSNPDHHSCFWDENSACEPLLESSHSLTSEEFCQTKLAVDSPATRCFVTPVKGRQSVGVDSQLDVSSPEAGRAPFRPLEAVANRSRPPFLSPLCSPRKPRNARLARPVRAMMDIFLDSRAEESGDESFRDIEGRLGISKYMNTPESPTPPPSRASSRDTDSTVSTPTRALGYSPPDYSPRRRPGLNLWRTHEYQEYSSESTASPRSKKPWTLASQRDRFWKREAERLKSCAPKILLPSWHLGLTGQGDGEDTERLMTLAEVSLAEVEQDMGDFNLDLPERLRFEVSSHRSTANWP